MSPAPVIQAPPIGSWVGSQFRVRRRAAPALRRTWGRGEWALLVLIALAWAVASWVEVTGRAAEVHHGRLASGQVPLLLGAALMLLVWQVMTAAMMLPAALPAFRAFRAASPKTGAAMRSLAYLIAYFGVWTAFALGAFVLDSRVHVVVDGWPWLAAHPVVIASGTFALAAAYQCSRLKRSFLGACRQAGEIAPPTAPGPRAGLVAGARYGCDCVGACWALMLVMFAAGAAHLVWMVALGLVILLERSRRGAGLAIWTGVAFALLAALAPLVPILAPPA